MGQVEHPAVDRPGQVQGEDGGGDLDAAAPAPAPRRTGSRLPDGGDVEPGIHEQQDGGGRGRELDPWIHPEGHIGGAGDGEDQEDVEAHPGRPVVAVELPAWAGSRPDRRSTAPGPRPQPCTATPSVGPCGDLPATGPVTQGMPLPRGRLRLDRPVTAHSASLRCPPPWSTAGGPVQRGSARSEPRSRAATWRAAWVEIADHRRDPGPRAVGVEGPRLGVVGQVELEDLLQPLHGIGVGHRDHGLHPAVEVAPAEVGRPDVVGGRTAGGRRRSGGSGSARGTARRWSGPGWSRTAPARRDAGSRCPG